VLAAAPEMKPSKMRDNLIEHAEAARLSRKLVELICDSPLPEPLEALAIKGIPEEPLREFLDHHGFKTLLARLGAQSHAAPAAATASQAPTQAEVRPEPKIDRSLYETVADEAALDRWIAEISRLGRVAIDTETDGRDCVSARLVGISLATDCNKACYIPLEHGGDDMFAERPDQLPAERVLARLKPLLEDEAILKIGHNLKFDWVVLNKRGIDLAPYDDTLVMSFNLDAGGLNSHSLDDLAKKHLDHECIAFKDVCGSGQKQISFDKVPVDRATEYAAEDADVALRLWIRFRARMPLEKATRVYEMVDRPDGGGGRADGARRGQGRPRRAEALSAEFNVQIAALEEEICGAAGMQVHHRQPATARRHIVQQDGPERRPQGQVRDLVDRRHRARAAGPRRRADRPAGARLAPALEAQVHLYRRAAGADKPRHRAGPHQLQPVGRADRAAGLDRPELYEHPDPHRDRPTHPRRLHRRTGPCRAVADYSQIELRLAPTSATCRSCAPPSRRARTSTIARRRNCSARSIATRAGGRRQSTSPSSTASRAGVSPSGSNSRRTRRRR
jgi:hypothetical protein